MKIIEVTKKLWAFKQHCCKPSIAAAVIGILVAAHVGNSIRRLCQEPSENRHHESRETRRCGKKNSTQAGASSESPTAGLSTSVSTTKPSPASLKSSTTRVTLVEGRTNGNATSKGPGSPAESSEILTGVSGLSLAPTSSENAPRQDKKTLKGLKPDDQPVASGSDDRAVIELFPGVQADNSLNLRSTSDDASPPVSRLSIESAELESGAAHQPSPAVDHSNAPGVMEREFAVVAPPHDHLHIFPPSPTNSMATTTSHANKYDQDEAAAESESRSIPEDPAGKLGEFSTQFPSLCGEDSGQPSCGGDQQEALTLEEMEVRSKTLCEESVFRTPSEQLASLYVDTPNTFEFEPLLMLGRAQLDSSVGSHSTAGSNLILQGESKSQSSLHDEPPSSSSYLSALTNLTLNSESNTKRIAGSPALNKEQPIDLKAGISKDLEAVAGVMKSNPNDVNIQLKGFDFSELVGMVDASIIIGSGVVESTIRAMKLHESKTDIQRKGCSALNTLALACSSNERMTLKEMGAKEAIDAALAVLKKVDGLGI